MTSVDGKTTDVRIIFRTEEFEKFYNSLNTRVKDKFEYTFELVQTVYALPVKYIKTCMRCVYLLVQMNIGRCYLRLITVMSYYQCQVSFVLLVLWVLSLLQHSFYRIIIEIFEKARELESKIKQPEPLHQAIPAAPKTK